MQYISTRDKDASPVSASEAIVRGIAPDGGLYVPQNFPAYFPAELAQKSYLELAEQIFALYLSDFSAAEIAEITRAAYGGGAFPALVAPAVDVGPFTVLELFHGPTAAFKDMALQILPRFLTRARAKTGRQEQIVILVATSGDTGSAALAGFKDVAGCRIIVFYPADGVSELQERQMLCAGGNNTAVRSVHGNFDDCQSGVKAIFADQALAARLMSAGLSFSSANSINFGRLLPQIVYYYHGYGQLVARGRLKLGQELDVAVPTGNFGNILAAYYAKRMGLPIGRLICASNDNDVLDEAIGSGHYNRLRPFHKTDSPSMDILVSSNFERFLFEMYGREAATCAKAMADFSASGSLLIDAGARENWRGLLYGGTADNDAAARVIGEVFAQYQYLLDPHTAVGWAVAERYRAEGRPLLITATASPYKFPAAVLLALGKQAAGLSGPEQLALLQQVSQTPIPEPLATAAQGIPPVRAEVEIAAMKQAVKELLFDEYI